MSSLVPDCRCEDETIWKDCPLHRSAALLWSASKSALSSFEHRFAHKLGSVQHEITLLRQAVNAAEDFQLRYQQTQKDMAKVQREQQDYQQDDQTDEPTAEYHP